MAAKINDLPVEMIAEIFKHIAKETLLVLRGVCRSFQHIIDGHTGSGYSAVIDDTGYPHTKVTSGYRSQLQDKFEFYAQVCIGDAQVQRLELLDYFLYPFSLKKLSFRPGIPNAVIINILRNCRNLTEIRIEPTDKGTVEFEDLDGQFAFLPKLESVKFSRWCHTPDLNSGVAANNYLAVLKQIRAPNLQVFILSTWWTPPLMKILSQFLIYHHVTLKEVSLNLRRPAQNSPVEQQQLEIHDLTTMTNECESIFETQHLHQKEICFIGLSPGDFSVLYPMLKAQKNIEKLTVIEQVHFNDGGTVKLNWNLFQPIFTNNFHIEILHLSLESTTPFDFAVLENLLSLRDLGLNLNVYNRFDARTQNGINCHKISSNLENLELSNFLLLPEELQQLPMTLKKIRKLFFIHSRRNSFPSGLQLETVRNFLRCRTLNYIMLQGVDIQNETERLERYLICRILVGILDSTITAYL